MGQKIYGNGRIGFNLVQLLQNGQAGGGRHRQEQTYSDNGLQRRAERREKLRRKGGCMRDEMGIASGTRAELCYAGHAEQNAICQAAKRGISVEGATIYVTHQPCVICAKMIVNSGITRIMYKHPYPDEFSLKILEEAGIELIHYTD